MKTRRSLTLAAALTLTGLGLAAAQDAPPAPPQDAPPRDAPPTEEAPTDPSPDDARGRGPEGPTRGPRRVRLTLQDGSTVEGELLGHSKVYRVRAASGVVELAEAKVRRVDFLSDRIDVDADQGPIGEVMDSIARQSGRTIVAESSLAKKTLSLSLRQIPWREALDVIARMIDARVEEIGESFFLEPAVRVTLDFRNANLRSALSLVGAYAGRSLVFGPEVRGTISLRLVEVEFGDALRAIAYAASLEMQSKPGGVVSVRPLARRPAPPEPKWRSFPLPPQKGAPAPKRVTLELRKVSLEDALDKLGVLVQRNFLAEPNCKGSVDLNLRNAPWPEALQLIARQTGCRMRTGHGIVLFEQPSENALAAQGASAASWFMALGEFRNKSVVVAPEVNGLIKVGLERAFLDDAFEQSARAYGYRVAEFGEITVVTGERYDPDARASGVQVTKLELPKADPKAAPAPMKLSNKQLQALEGRVEGAFRTVQAAADSMDVEALVPAFQALRDAIRDYEAQGAQVDRGLLAKWRQRLKGYGELSDAIELQVAITEGNGHLKAMSKAIQEKKAGAAALRYAQLEQLVARMRGFERDVFRRNADALALRGAKLLEAALGTEGRIRIDANTTHQLHLESILWSPEDDLERRSLCVILGRVYREGDTYVLPSGEELADVRIVKIAKDRVEVRAKTVDLTLSLQP